MARGWKLSAQTKKKMAAAQRGRKHSAATKAKIGAGSRRFWDRIRQLQADAESSANA